MKLFALTEILLITLISPVAWQQHMATLPKTPTATAPSLSIACSPSQPSCGQAFTPWSVTPSPNASTSLNSLEDVAGSSWSDVWAVGYYYDNTGTYQYPLAEQWNGPQWSLVTTPTLPGNGQGYFSGVAVVSPGDAWAVGRAGTNAGSFQAVAEHWGGTQWKLVSIPTPDPGGDVVNSVTALSSTDVWAVGSTYPAAQPRTWHWDGTQWTYVTSPTLTGSGDSAFNDVAGDSATNVWAVGYTSNATSPYLSTLVEHWDGSLWSVIPSPDYKNSEADNVLQSLAIASPNNIWAVGWYDDYAASVQGSVIEHWNGSQWTLFPTPAGEPANTRLDGVAIAGPTDVYAVGGSVNPDTTSPGAVVEAWDGHSWRVSVVNGLSGSNNVLHSVVAFSPVLAWGVGCTCQQSLVIRPSLPIL